jgi:hypothetical protein
VITVVGKVAEQYYGVIYPAASKRLDRLEHVHPVSLDAEAVSVAGPACVMVAGDEVLPAVELLKLRQEPSQSSHPYVTKMPDYIVWLYDRVPVLDDRRVVLLNGREAAYFLGY